MPLIITFLKHLDDISKMLLRKKNSFHLRNIKRKLWLRIKCKIQSNCWKVKFLFPLLENFPSCFPLQIIAMFSSGKTRRTLKVVIPVNGVLQLILKVRKLHYGQLIMDSGGHSYSKGIYKKKFEGMKQSLSVQIQGQLASGDTRCWAFSAIHLRN